MRFMKWEPAIYEHKAALIGESPWDVAHSAELLSKALIAEYDTYGADLMTVGIDVYNLEAEACGARLIATDAKSCPEVDAPVLDLNDLPERISMPDVPGSGRFRLLLEAGAAARDRLGGRTRVRVAASGPVSIAAKLVGTEPLIVSLAVQDGKASRLLEFAAQLAERWCRVLRDHDLEVVVFDSSAAPPMFSPDMYRSAAAPLHARLMKLLSDRGQPSPPLIIGGDTSGVASDLVATGAGMLICDFTAEANVFARELRRVRETGTGAGAGAAGEARGAREPERVPRPDLQPIVRRNLDPALLTSADPPWDRVVPEYVRDLSLFERPVAGTGILPYDTDPRRYSELKQRVEAEYAAATD